MAHNSETITHTRAIEAALDVVAIHHEHTVADQLELSDLWELLRIHKEREKLDANERCVWQRLWERNGGEDGRHVQGGDRAKAVCQILEKTEPPAVAR